MVKYYYPAIYGDTPIDDEYGHEGRLYVSEGDYAALEARLAELEKGAARYRWIMDCDDFDGVIEVISLGSDDAIDRAMSREA